MELKEDLKDEIIDRNAPNGSQRTWKDWLKDPAFYKVIFNLFLLERFSLECHKTKTKLITLANHNRRKQHNEPIRIRSKYM